MATLSLDLRSRILATYDEGGSTREEVARRYRVSLGMVKKLLQQRRRTGDLAPRHRYSGRKPKTPGRPPPSVARLGARTARPHPGRAARRRRLGLHPASHPLRAQKNGPDI